MMRDVYVGKLYPWSGNALNYGAATSTYRYITKNAGGTGIEDNGTSGPTNSSSADLIISDDLWQIGAKTASIRIKATKVAGGVYTAGTHYCNGFSAVDVDELSASVSVGSGTTALWMSNAGVLGSGSVQIPTYLTGADENGITYTHVHFFSDGTGKRIAPIRFIAVFLPLQSGSGNPSGNTWNLEVQWYYTR